LPIEVVKVETGASSDNDDVDDDAADPSFEIDVPEKLPKIKRKRRTRSKKYESDESEYDESVTKKEHVAKHETTDEPDVESATENDQNKTFKCIEPNCGKTFSSQSGLDAHKHMHQGLDVSQFGKN
jgi:hypothetical protein